MTGAQCRGLIVVVFDTLRADFLRLCADESVGTLGSFSRLFRKTNALPRLVCGSFPTVPMRTDLLTGELSFLDRQWARPRPDQRVLTDVLRGGGAKNFLVTDTYMTFVPELGFDMRPLFDDATIIRGRGSDPFATPTGRSTLPLHTRPTRSRRFDEQFLANLAATGADGESLSNRFFREAQDALERAARTDRFLLWIDCFAIHEPWIDAQALRDGIADDEPLWPPYGPAAQLQASQLSDMKRRYCECIRGTDEAMSSFVDAVDFVMNDGDVALAVVSDHGFYLGEFGLIGKPKPNPVLPPLFDLVGQVSPHFESLLPAGDAFVQPHELTAPLAAVLGVHWEGGNAARTPLLLGRNSEDVQTLTVLSEAGIGVLWRNSSSEEPAWVRWEDLTASAPWSLQKLRDFSDPFTDDAFAADERGHPWLQEFSRQLELLDRGPRRTGRSNRLASRGAIAPTF